MSAVNSRKFVLDLLNKCERSGAYSNILLDNALKCGSLSGTDRKFASALFYGVLKRKITLDYLINIYAKRPDKLSVELRNILRIGIYQIMFLDSVPDRAAVNESVALAKGLKNPSAAGFVNALLRRFASSGRGAEIESITDPKEKLSLKYSVPRWIIDLWANDYGMDKAETLAESTLKEPTLTARFNTLRFTEEEIIGELSRDNVSAIRYPDDKLSCYELSGCGAVEKLSAYKKGMLHIQGLTSQICCAELDIKPGDTVIDMCAAPGGKSFTLSEYAGDSGKIYSYDLHPNRLSLIRSGAERLGLKNIVAAQNDARAFSDKIPMSKKILCDVPCSGLGVLNHKPDIKYRPFSEIEELPQIQYEILDASSKYLLPGGTLVYSTCTLRKAENDEVVEKFLALHPDFEPTALLWDGSLTSVSLMPDTLGADGFYIAKLFRKA